MGTDFSPQFARQENKMMTRCRLGVFVVGLFSVSLMASAVQAQAETLPTRKGGLWEQQTTMDQGDGPQKHTLTICIGEQMEAQTAANSIQHHRSNCSRYDIKKTDGETFVEAECTFNDRPVSSTTEMTGDFDATFNIKIVSKTTIAEQGQSRVLTRTINQVGKYLGSDCGELKPGEAKGASGEKVLVQ